METSTLSLDNCSPTMSILCCHPTLALDGMNPLQKSHMLNLKTTRAMPSGEMNLLLKKYMSQWLFLNLKNSSP